jgi:hypothetical protein
LLWAIDVATFRFLTIFYCSRNTTGQRVSGYVADRASGKRLDHTELKLLCGSGQVCSDGKPGSGGFTFDVGPGSYAIKIHRTGYFDEEYSEFYAQAGFNCVYYPLYLDRCRGKCTPAEKPVAGCE